MRIAGTYLQRALRLRDQMKSLPSMEAHGLLRKVDAYRALGELSLRLGDLGKAEENLRQGMERYVKLQRLHKGDHVAERTKGLAYPKLGTIII